MKKWKTKHQPKMVLCENSLLSINWEVAKELVPGGLIGWTIIDVWVLVTEYLLNLNLRLLLFILS
jgi:hypothetical protein